MVNGADPIASGDVSAERRQFAWFSSPKTWKWHWIAWEVFFPLGMPVLMAGLVMILWATGPMPLPLAWSVVIDITPWTLTFFAVTLLSTSLRRSRANEAVRDGLFWVLLLQAAISAFYFSCFVIWRHVHNYNPGVGAYFLSTILALSAVRTCHANA